jgi:hypothetical protein
MTIAEFDKLHDMLRVIHSENMLIIGETFDKNAPEALHVMQDYYNTAFRQAEQGRLKKWEYDGNKLD